MNKYIFVYTKFWIMFAIFVAKVVGMYFCLDALMDNFLEIF